MSFSSLENLVSLPETKETEKRDDQAKDEQPLTLSSLHVSVDPDGRHRCMCHECKIGWLCNFQICYFLYFGLDLSGCILNNRKAITIKSLLIARCLVICEDRVRKVFFEVHSLKHHCLHVCAMNFHFLSKIPFPQSLRTEIQNFKQGQIIEEKLSAIEPGRSIFKCWKLCRFLYRHRGKFISVDVDRLLRQVISAEKTSN